MFLLRTTRTATAARVAATSRAAAPFTTSSFRFASGDYGSGAHKHGKELEKESHDKEHPGPPPPSTGGKSKSSESSQPSSSGSSSGQPQSNNGGAAQPKILNDARPKEGEESEEVRKHNEEFRKRADRQQDGKKDDKVDKEFWKGQGGVDREP